MIKWITGLKKFIQLHKHIKGKQNILADSLSGLRHLGLHDDNDTELLGQEYGKSNLDMDENTVNKTESVQNINDKFEIDSIKYSQDEKDLANTRLQNTSTNVTGTNSLPCICNFDLQKIKWLQDEDEYIAKLIDKCKSTKHYKIPFYLDEHGIIYRKIRDRPNIFHTIMVPNTLQPIFHMKAIIN